MGSGLHWKTIVT